MIQIIKNLSPLRIEVPEQYPIPEKNLKDMKFHQVENNPVKKISKF